MNRFFGMAAVLALVTAGAATAQADSLVSPPGVYYGNGNTGTNGSWTVTPSAQNANPNIEVGLRAKLRQDPSPNSIVPTTDTIPIYEVPAGLQTLFGGSMTRAAWNWEFSINLQAFNPPSGLTLAAISANTVLHIEDLNTLTTVDVSVVQIPDNSSFGASGVNHWNPVPPGAIVPPQLNDWAVQNSENPVFTGDMPPDYSIVALHKYLFTLEVKDSPTGVLASDQIEVDVVPLPSVASMGLSMFGVAGGAFLFAKRRAKLATV